MSNWHTPKKPTPQQLSLIKERYEVSGAGIVVKTKYHCGPEVGEPVGSLQSHGYLRINNSPENLREVSQSQNQKAYGKTRGAVGYRGVDFFKSQSKYRARASINGKHKHAGYYDTPEEAAIARDLKAYKDFNYPWEGLNEIGQEYILKHHPDWIKDEM